MLEIYAGSVWRPKDGVKTLTYTLGRSWSESRFLPLEILKEKDGILRRSTHKTSVSYSKKGTKMNDRCRPNHFLYLPVFLLTLALSVPAVRAEDQQAVIAKSSIVGGRINEFVVEGRYLYGLGGARLTVIDMEAEGGAKQIRETFVKGAAGFLNGLVKAGSDIYISDHNTLWRFSIHEPTRPIQTGALSIAGKIIGVADNRAFIVSREGVLNIVSIDPGQPMRLLNSHLVHRGGGRFTSRYSEHRLVTREVTSDSTNSILRIFDVKEPDSIKELGNVLLPVSRFIVDGDRIVVYGYECKCLQIIDISDPSNPTLLGSEKSQLDKHRKLVGASMDQELVALELQDPIVQIEWIDVSDPLRPVSIALTPLPGIFPSMSLNFSEQGAVMSSSSGLHFFETKTLSDISETGRLPRLAYSAGGCSFEERWLIGGSEGSIWMSDTSESLSLKLLAKLEPPTKLSFFGSHSPIACSDDKAYIFSNMYERSTTVTGTSQLYIVDMQDQAQPKLTRVPIPVSGAELKLAHTSGEIVVTLEESRNCDYRVRFRVWDSSSPELLNELGHLDFFGTDLSLLTSLAADGTTAVAAIDEKIYLIDVTTPSQPRLKTELTHSAWIRTLDMQGRFIIFIDQEDRIGIIDVHSGTTVALKPLVATSDDSASATSVVIDRSRAYFSGTIRRNSVSDPMSRSESVLWTMDLTNPALPLIHQSPSIANGMIRQSNDGRRIGITGDHGFAQLELELPTPNPQADSWARVWLPWLRSAGSVQFQ